MSPADLIPLLTFQAFLIFCRLGTAIFIFPALSDTSIPPRTRLGLAVATTLVLLPFLQPQMPQIPLEAGHLVTMLASELVIGLLLGLAARLLLAALSITGELIAFMAGFQSATLFDPQSGASSVAPTIFLTLTAGVLILAFNLHHTLLQGVVESYKVFTPGQFPAVADATQAVIHIVAQLTRIGLQLAAPVVLAGFLVNLAFGIFNRLIPQIQVYFLSVPASIVLSLLLLMAALTSLFTLFIGTLQDNLFLYQLDATDD